MRSRWGTVLLGAATVVAVLGGCAAAPAAPPSPSPPVSSAPAPSPSPSASLSLEEDAQQRLEAMSVRQKLATMLMLHYPGTDAEDLAGFMRTTGAGASS
ncbi:hypothetical protein [Naasia aerilata]|uniref:Uncharacterized protein n=1 Tax=Naasia aerilata TaxID=1162966 RepID=A0ABN6XNM2_9MICO|nr:hypothetical protein [Naasia aerilata]BDZ46594.1 hypothetical protein GCM10025866_25030 [Naasia aerilata]